MNTTAKRTWRSWWGLWLLCALPCLAEPDIYFVEEWTSDEASWVDRDAGEMELNHDAVEGLPPGALRGDFAFLPSGFPETDAFRAEAGSSGGNLTGDYLASLPFIQGWAFDFLADDVLPSSVLVRFGDSDTNIFFQAVTPHITSAGEWQPVQVSVQDESGWSGPAGVFTSALSDVVFVDVQVTRNGTGAQSYYLDNFRVADRLPRAMTVERVDDLSRNVTWTNLQPGRTHEVQSTAALTSDWATVDSFMPTNIVATRQLATNAPAAFYRVYLP